MSGRILRQLRESKGRSQAEVAKSVGMSAAKLARLESNQRGLYLEDFIRIAEALGEQPGNLLPNDLGDIGYLKPLIDRIASVPPRSLEPVAAIIEQAVLLAGKARPRRLEKQNGQPQRASTPTVRKKRR